MLGSGRAFGGSCRWLSCGIAIGQGAQSNGASPPCTLARSNGGPWPGTHRSGRGCSSQVGGREPGIGIPLYGHRNPGSLWPDAGASNRARWLEPCRGGVAGSERRSRGVFFGSGDFRAAWPSSPPSSGAIHFGVTNFSTSRPPFGEEGRSTWRGVDLEGGGRSAFRSPSEDKDGQGPRVSVGSLSPRPRCGKENLAFVSSFRRGFLREPEVESGLPFFIPGLRASAG